MTAQPAFAPVAARRTLVKDPPSTAPPKATNFSSAVVDYVQRAFFEFNRQKDTPLFVGITDKDIRVKLSSIVNQATAEGITNSRDWSTYPLPHEFVLEERRQAATMAAPMPHLPLANTNHAYGQPTATWAPEPALQNKKRKSPDQEVADSNGQAVTPPWKKPNTKTLAERITGKSKNQEKKQKNKANANWFDTSDAALAARRQRFGNVSPDASPYISSRDDSPDANTGPIVGTCEVVEKNYFRLTAPPNPSTVRPLPVLKKALDHLFRKWKQDHNYNWLCDQMKSLRQDITVQRIKTPFTIKVYERHARIALQMKDLGEYNQCQTQLRALYKSKLGENGTSGGAEDEFTAYRILYLIYTRNRTDMSNMLADLTTADKQGQYVQMALQIRAALASGNHHKFFQLYRDSQDLAMFPYLMDMFVDRERLAALAVMCRAFKPDVRSTFLVKELAFDSVDDDTPASEDDAAAHNQRKCLEFIQRYSGDGPFEDKGDGDIRVLTGKAGHVFEQAKQAAFGRVDIKGQI
ncbi:hypothetical protein CLAFUW4_08583 [Fulvia fulva]|uniref:SAC3/GANP/THP3 conserved domain-containing protein n=1 Tax=Passalora fulva TaxID=5499 RepID=A0A9Q8LC60_PASFU|nr:uncharacterized protein CLAFUR5_08685 [Fulvia fulva]KAK4630497.1 hypothetical protein CLAFUR0_08581 [Fulvia fulva]UJO14718.1 hypothetical protein CLAFUR5_08685 [Fulvia fulva]WPV12440.1 hypothetical protein CLAFUW4_08583 [Fulvia fulva]